MAADDTVTLTATEARVLALYLAAEHLANCDVDVWLQWEDVPQLDEASWYLLHDTIKESAFGPLRAAVAVAEGVHGIDARLLAERAEAS